MRFLGVLAFVVGIGCGADAPTGGIDFDEFGKSFAELLCEKMRECGVDITDDVCREVYGADLTYGGVTSHLLAIDDGRVIYDAQAAADCFDELHATSCRIMLDAGGEVFNHGRSCNFIVRPNTAVGEACYGIGTEGSQSECVHGADCAFPMPECGQSACCEGECVAVTEVAAEGEACDSGTPCSPFLACVDGVCGFGEHIGDPCRDYCAGDLVCDWQTDSCQELVPAAAAGEPCPGQTRCAFPTRCVFSTAQDSYVCMAPVGIGEECSGLTELPACHPGLYCDGDPGVCVEAARYGDSCEQVPCLANFFVNRCRDGTCQKPGPDGASCAIGDHCLSDNCVDGACAPPETCP